MQLAIWQCHIYFREAITIFPVKCLVHFTGVRVGLCVSACPVECEAYSSGVAKKNCCMFVVNLFFSEKFNGQAESAEKELKLKRN